MTRKGPHGCKKGNHIKPGTNVHFAGGLLYKLTPLGCEFLGLTGWTTKKEEANKFTNAQAALDHGKT